MKGVATMQEFNDLDFDRQAYIVWHHGLFLIRRKTAGIMDKLWVNLYWYGGFYISLYYDGRRNKIVRFIATDNGGVVLPYLDGINIDDIWKK